VGDQVPYKDKEVKAKYDTDRQKETYHSILLKIRKDAGIWDAIEKMKAERVMPPSTYAQKALIAQLKRDGYLPQDKNDYDPQNVVWPKPD